jgi:hypothetical protein
MKNKAEVGIFVGVLLLLGITILEFACLAALTANF